MSCPDEARARKLFLLEKAPRLVGTLAYALAEIRDIAWDHPDAVEHMQAITIAADAARRIREIGAACSRPEPFNDMAEAIEGDAWPLENEAMNWDDARDAIAHGNKLDQRRENCP